MSTRTWDVKGKDDKSPVSSKQENISVRNKSYHNISSFYDGLSDSEDSVGENLDKLKELFSGKKESTKGSSPPKILPLIKTNTMQA